MANRDIRVFQISPKHLIESHRTFHPCPLKKLCFDG